MISLDILIPTFNRRQPLIKNLSLLDGMLSKIKDAKVRILVSDNASIDGTREEVEQFIEEHSHGSLLLFSQKENLGLTKNVISILEKSNADYILILGDDDYLNNRYLETAIKVISEDDDVSCVLPSFEGITEYGERLCWGRDLGMKTRFFDSGIQNAVDNSYRAHQISGILLKREGLFKALKEKNITNLYPQIFMVAFSCLHGKCVHIPEYPVLVTQTTNKAWRYDDVGLLNDIFQNYKALELEDKYQFRLERKIVCAQTWRALQYWKNPFKQVRVIFQIANGPYTSKRGKYLFPLILSYYWAFRIMSAVKGRILKLCR